MKNFLLLFCAVHCPTRQIVKALETYQSQTYRYLFSHVSDSPLMWSLGAGHALELPFVFGNLSLLRTVNEYVLSDQIQSYWSQFAATGNPNRSSAVNWPKSANENYLNIDSFAKAEAGFHHEQCEFWDQL